MSSTNLDFNTLDVRNRTKQLNGITMTETTTCVSFVYVT